MINNLRRIHIEAADLTALLFYIWTITPIWGSWLKPIRLLVFFCVCFWLLRKNKIIFNDKITILLGIVLLVGVSVLEYFANGLSSSFSWTINRGLYFVGAVIGIYYATYEKEKFSLFVISGLIAINIIAIISIMAVINDPYAIREATYRYDEEQYSSLATYNFIYLCALLFPQLLVGIFFLKGRKFLTYLLLLTISITGLLIAFSGFMIANLCVLFSIFLFLILHKPSLIKTIFIVSFIVIAAILLPILGKYLFHLLLALTNDSPIYYRKINGLYTRLFEGGTNIYDVQIRSQLYFDSWKALILYPLFGSIFFTGKNMTGGHSVLVDLPAAYGWLIGFAFIWIVLIKPYKLVRSYCSINQDVKTMVQLLFIFPTLFCGLFNNFSYSFTWVWYIYIQYLCVNLEINNRTNDKYLCL